MSNLSPQQAAAVAFMANGTGSAIIKSGAGTGKTFTIKEMVKVATNTTAILAYNKKAANEIQERISPLGLDHVKVGTVHSFGFGAIRRGISRVKVDGNKLKELARREFNGEYESLRQFVISAVSQAKQAGIGALSPIEDMKAWYDLAEHFSLFDCLPEKFNPDQGIDAAQYLLNVSNSLASIVDFDDMIYLPILHKMKIWQYDNVFLDEAQDTNATRRALVKMMLKPKGRLIAVGDDRQAIYGFTGADNDSLDLIKDDFNTEVMNLSVTYRCPKSVVSLAHNWVPEDSFQAHESAPDGIVDSCELQDLPTLVSQNDAILCRNTKPLVELAYRLIRQSIPCKVEGRSIGEGLIKLCERWKSAKTVGELSARLDSWQEKEIAKHKAKGNDSRCQQVEDQYETLQVFIMQCDDSDSISVLAGKIRDLFGDTEFSEVPVLTLSTIHKSKGREWDRVFCLGMDTYSPSKWARKPWEILQEDNLCYVQVTRAKQHLTLVNVPAKDT